MPCKSFRVRGFEGRDARAGRRRRGSRQPEDAGFDCWAVFNMMPMEHGRVCSRQSRR